MAYRLAAIRLAVAAGLCAAPALARPAAATIIDEWGRVSVPPAPELKAVTLDPKTTAFLVLDIVHQRCDARPRCVAGIKPVRSLLDQARKSGTAVVYSLIAGATPADVVNDLTPAAGEPVVTAGADKFLGTDLEKILQGKGIKTLMIVGTAAEGAVLSTAAEAAMRGFQVVVPVDGATSALPYAEQYTAWHLVNAPGPAGHVTLTKSDMVKF